MDGSTVYVPKPAQPAPSPALGEKVKHLCEWVTDTCDWVENAPRHINTDTGRSLAREVLALLEGRGSVTTQLPTPNKD